MSDAKRPQTVEYPGADKRLPALLTVPRAAALLGISRASAYRYAAAGELPTKRYGRRVYVVTNQIRDVLDDVANREEVA